MAKEKICGIYRINNMINGKNYIGSSVDIEKRWNVHKSQLRNNKHGNKYLQSSCNKYGFENFKFVELEICQQDELEWCENFWVFYYKSNEEKFGYNLRKVSQNNFGLKHSDESIKIMSEKKKGTIFTPQHKKRLSDSHINKNHTFETIEKMSESHKKENLSPQTIKRMSEASAKRRHTIETKTRISKIQSGENGNNVKLTWELVDIIRFKYENEKISQQKLAVEFEVARTCIQKIVEYRTWKLENRPNKEK